MKTVDTTLSYYNSNANEFINQTKDVEFSSLQNEFLSYLKPGATILDLGCGSGRDSKSFIENGYKVTAIDGSKEICKATSDYIGQPVICSTFQDYRPQTTFDGIWACASLLHLSIDDISIVMKRLSNHLRYNGCFYISFKYGRFSGMRNGRYYTDMTEASLERLLRFIPDLTIDKTYITSDVRPGRDDEKWINAFLIKHA